MKRLPVLLVFLSLLTLGSGVASGQVNISYTFSESDTTIGCGDTLTVDVDVDSITDMLGYSLVLNYDQTVFQPISAVQGALIDGAACSPFFQWLNSGSNDGTVQVDLAMLGCTVTGSGSLLRVQFIGVDTGATPLTSGLTVTGDIRDDQNQDIAYTADSATMTSFCNTVPVAEDALEAVAGFVAERLRGLLREKGFRYDVVDAVLAERGDDPYSAYRAAAQLSAWVDRDDWQDLLNAYGRSIRIVRDLDTRFEFVPGIDPEAASAVLREAYEGAKAQITPESDVDRLFTALHPMIPAINAFFDDVLVMHEDRALQDSRLGLLQDIWELGGGVVDVTRLEGF